MHEGRIAQKAARMRQLGDGKADAVRAQCQEAAEYWGNGVALSKLAEYLGAGKAKLNKWAGAGAVMQAEIAGEEWPIELSYQVALWDRELWDDVADVVCLADLKASELNALRLAHYKLAGAAMTIRLGKEGFDAKQESD